MEGIRLSGAHICLMLRESVAALPREACGIITGRRGSASRIFTAVNAARTLHRFAIAPEELRHMLRRVEKLGDHWLGIWHSHPQSAAIPSAADIRYARHPDLVWVIVSLVAGDRAAAGKGIRCGPGVIRGYKIDGSRSRFREVPVERV